MYPPNLCNHNIAPPQGCSKVMASIFIFHTPIRLITALRYARVYPSHCINFVSSLGGVLQCPDVVVIFEQYAEDIGFHARPYLIKHSWTSFVIFRMIFHLGLIILVFLIRTRPMIPITTHSGRSLRLIYGVFLS